MLLPSVEQYADIIEKKDPRNFSFLNEYDFLYFEKDHKKEFCFSIGTCAAVFKARKSLEDYAIRCFLRGELETFKRYEQLNAFMADKNLSWKVNFDFLENEIQVDGHWLPVVKMDWVYGIPLNKFIDEVLLDHSKLTELQQKLVGLSISLEENGIGHGDLKYNNIFIQKQGFDFTLKLVDYDSMFIPAFRGKNNLEPGSPGFQHPRRLAGFFTDTIDRFSIWVMLTALEVIKLDAPLWREVEKDDYTNSEHSLFNVMDFINPANSRLFQKLRSHNNEALNFYLDKLVAACNTRDLNSIEKPGLYKGHHLAFAPKPTPATPPVIAIPQPKEKQYEVEVKTIPAGKDVLVNEVKKGITPLTLQLTENEFGRVVVINEGERVPVLVTGRTHTYEIDFSLKPKETIAPPPSPPVEKDEILEFKADKYSVQEGELATLNWKVKGPGRIHISNMGDVEEKTGTKKVVLQNTTDYVLSIGSENRSLRINVQPQPKPVPAPAQPVTLVEESKPADPAYPAIEEQLQTRRNNNKILQVVLILMGVLVISFLAFRFISGTKNARQAIAPTETTPVQAAKATTPPLFTRSSITSFLNGLYDAYNKRNLSSIMSHYAPSVQEYYDSKSLREDSLASIIKDLFISPVSYNCDPDFTTLKVEPQQKNCKVVITINEELKSNPESNTEKYTTTIEYLLDPSYRIISEKSPGDN